MSHHSQSRPARPFPAAPHRPPPMGRRAGLLPALLLMLAALLTTPLPSVHAQEAAPAGQAENGDDPAKDIYIEGIGFAKLILEMEHGEGLDELPGFKRLNLLLEKNLCWSGVFNLHGGRGKYCRSANEESRVDMRLELKRREGALALRLMDTGPENLLLFEQRLPVGKKVAEDKVMELVNDLTERVTGYPGLLGSAIAFVLRQPRYAKVIAVSNTHGKKIRAISHNRGINLLPKWNPSGSSIVYTVLATGGTKVYLHQLAANGSDAGTSRYITERGTLNTGGTFSPDGKRLVLTMSVDKGADLYQLDLNGLARKRLTSRRGIETQANWSPDGSKIVFVSDRTGTPQIYLLDMETREDLRITFDGVYNADPKWSPDGQLILFTKRVRGHDQIHIMDQYGENVREVTRGRYDAEQAEWSPDGRQIVFPSNRTGDFKLYVVSADGSNLRRLTKTGRGFEESSPSWTHRKLAR